jgi:hypothetical protein
LIYDNSTAPGFTDSPFAYSAMNPCDTTLYYDPTCSYSITYQAWGGTDWLVNGGTMSTSGYSSLSYRLYPNGQPISDFGALFTNGSGSVVKEIALSSATATPLSGGWYQVTIPLSQLNPSNVNISSIQLKNELNANLASVHYDDVMFVGSSGSTTPTATTVPPTKTPVPTTTPVPTSTPTKKKHH